MKNFLLFLSLFLFSISIFAHKQHVHQYLTVQGYNLLKNYVGQDILPFSSHLDNGPVGPP
jgi:hypothetical protein